MLSALQIIYEGLHNANPRSVSADVPIAQALRFLLEKEKLNPNCNLYRELIINVSKLKVQEVSSIYIERFCLGKLTDHILTVYPVNVGEAFAIAYVLLNKTVEMSLLHFKLGASGLLAPAMINGKRIEDVEAISQFIIKSLQDAELIKITNNRVITPGLKLKLSI